MMAAGISKAKQWIEAFRGAHASGQNRPGEVWVLVEAHAYYCACRELSEATILELLQSPGVTYRWQVNRAPSALPDSLLLELRDPDPDLPEHRRRIELSLIFPPDLPPIVCHAWREGSPRVKQGEPCWLSATDPPCQQRNRKPRGWIG